MTTTIPVPEDDDFHVVRPGFGPDGLNALEFLPIIAWRIDGPADSGQLVPITEYEDDEIEPGDVYAIQHPNGSYRFPDGERVMRTACLRHSSGDCRRGVMGN